MFYPSGFGLGSNWLLYIGVPLIIGIWAQIRVSSAFSRWSKVRDSANITGAECAREILQAAQIHDVDVVATNDFLGDHYDPTNKKLHLSSSVYHTPSVAALGIAAQGAHGDCAGDNDRIADAALCDYRRAVFSPHRSDYARHLLLSDSTGLPIDHTAGGVRRLAARKNHFAANGNRAGGSRSCRCEQRAERGRAHLRGSIYRGVGQLALAAVDPRSALIDRAVEEDESF